jgi:hypothetical protein
MSKLVINGAATPAVGAAAVAKRTAAQARAPSEGVNSV